MGRCLRLLLALSVGSGIGSARAQEQDQAQFANPDSVFVEQPATFLYETSYDRDRNRNLWTQTGSYFTSSTRSNLNLSGTVNTQDFVRSASKSTLGSFSGNLNLRLVKTWLLILNGNYGMNSSTDGSNDLDSRDNRLNVRTQYTAYPVRGMQTIVALYSEFAQKHDLTTIDRIRRVTFEDDSTAVDSTVAQRDSSFTNSRQDAVSGQIFWPARPWLELYGTGLAYRVHPTITSFHRTFTNPIDGSGPGQIENVRQQTTEPTDNILFTSRATITKLRATKITVAGDHGRLEQSYFDKQRSKQESALFDNTRGALSVQSNPFRSTVFILDASLLRNLSRYSLNTNRTALKRGQAVSATASYMDSSARASVSFSVDRAKTELQPTTNGVQINRVFNSSGMIRLSRRLAIDGIASATILVNDYENDAIDRDAQRTFLNVGGGYQLTPSCSTTVHFSRSRGHTIALDPSSSSGNTVTTSYQMNATLRLQINPMFTVRQDYLMSAEYRILDFNEDQNALVRVRRIDTDLVDTLFSIGFVRLTHNFLFQDQGSYSPVQGERRYGVATETYDQTLAASAGLRIVPGVLLIATQSLLNRRTTVLNTGVRTLANQWKLNVGLQVFRTLSNGLQINGAVRRIGEYAEGPGSTLFNTERRDDWIAGVSLQRLF